jgi:hypothetical protein
VYAKAAVKRMMLTSDLGQAQKRRNPTLYKPKVKVSEQDRPWVEDEKKK